MQRSVRYFAARAAAMASLLLVTACARKTVRLGVWLKTRDVKGNGFGKCSTPVLQSPMGGEILTTTDYPSAGLDGNRDWTRREVTLAAPRNADTLQIAMMLPGSGMVWFDDAVLQILPSPG